MLPNFRTGAGSLTEDSTVKQDSLQNGCNQVESLQSLTLQESALKEELLHAGESIQQSLNFALARLKDACSAEPAERNGSWLLQHVWRFCDDLQAMQMPRARSEALGETGRLGRSLASVRRRRAGLKDQLAHQVQCHEELKRDYQDLLEKKQQWQQRLEKCKEEVIALKSQDRHAPLEALTVEFSLQEASRFQKLDAEFKEALSWAEVKQKTEKEELIQQLHPATKQLQQLAQQLQRLRQMQRTLAASLRAELSKGKEALSRCGASLVEGAAAGCRQMRVLGLADEEHVQALQARLSAREQAGAEQLERQQKEALTMLEQVERLKGQATQEISRLLHEQSISEKQRSVNTTNARKTTQAISPSEQRNTPASCKTMLLAAEATKARTCALVDERERLETLCGAEGLFETQQSLKEALTQNEQLRRDLDLARLREQQSYTDQADAEATQHTKRLEEIQEKQQAGLCEMEQQIQTLEAQVQPLSIRLAGLKTKLSTAVMENTTLERERGLWRAQYELQQKLRQEVQQGMEQGRATWAKERDEMKEDISRGSEKLQRLKVHLAAVQESPDGEISWAEERQLEQELHEVERCLSAVTSTLAQRSAVRRLQQSDGDARLRSLWQPRR